MKECTKCKVNKDYFNFCKDKSRIDGYNVICKNCANDYRLNNKESLKEYYKEYRLNNKECIIKKQKEYYLNNKEKVLSRNKEYRLNNRKKLNDFRINKKIKNPLFRLRCNIGSLILKSITRQGYSKKSKTYEYLGCTFEEFKIHIEKQFIKGMTWDNQGEWHLDHIYPMSLAKDEQEVIKLNHYTNFQPLWAFDNLSKGNKIINKQLILI
jgi:hypothetical protein